MLCPQSFQSRSWWSGLNKFVVVIMCVDLIISCSQFKGRSQSGHICFMGLSVCVCVCVWESPVSMMPGFEWNQVGKTRPLKVEKPRIRRFLEELRSTYWGEREQRKRPYSVVLLQPAALSLFWSFTKMWLEIIQSSKKDLICILVQDAHVFGLDRSAQARRGQKWAH